MNMKLTPKGVVHTAGRVSNGVGDVPGTACNRSAETLYPTMDVVTCKVCLKIAAAEAADAERRAAMDAAAAIAWVEMETEHAYGDGACRHAAPVNDAGRCSMCGVALVMGYTVPLTAEEGARVADDAVEVERLLTGGGVKPKAWIMGCSSCKMPLVDNPAHLPGCEVALVREVLTDQGLPPVALNVEQLLTLISDVQREDAERVAEAPAWRCRDRVKATRVSRRRAQRGAMAR